MRYFDIDRHPRATNGTFTDRIHTPPEISLPRQTATPLGARFAFLTEDEIRDALPPLTAGHGLPEATSWVRKRCSEPTMSSNG